MSDKIFIDTNILIYLLKDNTGKAEILASKLDNSKNIISIQVINEFCNVALKKLNFTYDGLDLTITKLAEYFLISKIELKTIKRALKIKEKYQFSYYDSAIIASALENNCTILYSEDMQHNQLIENMLRIVNPFM